MADETANRRFERNGESRVGLTAQSGEDRRKAQDDERSSSSGRTIAKAVWRSRAGAHVKPPDPMKSPYRWKAPRTITKRRLSRGGDHGGLGGPARPPTRAKPSQCEGSTVRLQRSRRWARRRSKGSRQRCQRHGHVTAVGRKRPRSSFARLGRGGFADHVDPPKRSRTS